MDQTLVGFAEWIEEANRQLRALYPNAPTDALATWDGARWQWRRSANGRRWEFQGFLVTPPL